MFQMIYDFWVTNAPFLGDYGDWTYLLATLMTIYGFLRAFIVLPLYVLGFRKRL